AANRSRRHKRADRFANPAHPINFGQGESVLAWKQNRPRDRVQKNRHRKMKGNDGNQIPPGFAKCGDNLRRTLPNQKPGEKSYAGETKKVNEKMNSAALFHPKWIQTLAWDDPDRKREAESASRWAKEDRLQLFVPPPRQLVAGSIVQR